MNKTYTKHLLQSIDIQPNGTHATCSYDRDQSKLCLYKGAITRNVRETTRFTLNCLPLNPKYFFLLVKTSRTRNLCCYNSVFPIKCLECKYVIKSVRYTMSHWNVKLVSYIVLSIPVYSANDHRPLVYSRSRSCGEGTLYGTIPFNKPNCQQQQKTPKTKQKNIKIKTMKISIVL